MRAVESGVIGRHVRGLGLEFAAAFALLIENGAGWHAESLHHHVLAHMADLRPTQPAA